MSKIKIIKYTGSLNFVTIDYFTNKLQKIVPLRNGDASEVQRKNSILSIVKSVSEHVSLGNKDTFADSTQEEEQVSLNDTSIFVEYTMKISILFCLVTLV